MSETLFGATTPATTNNDPNSPRTLGVDFQAAIAGSVPSIRYYVPGPTKPVTVNVALFDPAVSTVTPMSTGTAAPGSVGWLVVALAAAQTLTPAHTYTAAAWISLGAASVQPDYGFTVGALSSDVVSGDLTALGGTGRFANSTPSLAYPTGLSSYNLFVDVVFNPTLPAVAGGGWGIAR